MEEMRPIRTFMIAMFASLVLSSCATVFTGSSPKVTIDGDINEPVTIVTKKKTYNNVSLPIKVKVKRHNIQGQRIHVTSESAKFSDIQLTKKFNPWFIGNVFNDCVGMPIDLLTNNVSKPKIKHFYYKTPADLYYITEDEDTLQYIYQPTAHNKSINTETTPNSTNRALAVATSPNPNNEQQTVLPSPDGGETKKTLSAIGLNYYSFDGFDNWGLGGYFISCNGFGMDLALRSQLKSHGNFNIDLGLNYSYQIYQKDNMHALLTLAAGPTFRTQDEPEIDYYGKITWKTGSFFCDAFITPHLTLYVNKFSITAGYYYWAPKWKFSKDDGARGGFCASIGYDF